MSVLNYIDQLITQNLIMQSFYLFIFYFVLGCCLVWSFKSSKTKTWWVKVDTHSPKCRYYFGPFDSWEEAEGHHLEYIEDLREEGAQGIQYTIEKGRPRQLTIEE